MGRKKLIEPRKTKARAVRFDIDLEEFINSHANVSKFINGLVRKEKERMEAVKAGKVIND